METIERETTILPIHLLARDEKGRPYIAGTRMRVSQIAAELAFQKLSPEDIHDSHPHLSLAQIHAALSYYYAHTEEIEAVLAEEKRFADAMRAQTKGHKTRAELEALALERQVKTV